MGTAEAFTLYAQVPNNAQAIATDGTYLMIANEYGTANVHTFDSETYQTAENTIVDQLGDYRDFLHDVTIIGNYAYFTQGDYDSYALSTTDWTVTTLAKSLFSYNLFSNTVSVANINDRYLALSSYFLSGNITLFDTLSAPAKPEMAGTLLLNDDAPVNMAADGDYLYTTTGKTISVIDISDVSHPKTVANFADSSYSLAVDGNYLYIAKGAQGMRILPKVIVSLPNKKYTTELIASAVETEYSLTEILNGNADIDNILTDLYLPTTLGASGISVSWESSDSSIINTSTAGAGIITRPIENTNVTLTGIVTYSNDTYEEYYIILNVTVLAEPYARATYGGVLSEALVDIYSISDLRSPRISTTTEYAYRYDTLDVSATGYFTYATATIDRDGTYLVHVYPGNYTEYYSPTYSNEDLSYAASYGNSYAIVSGEDLLMGDYTVNGFTDMIYRNVSYMLMANTISDADTYTSSTEELLAMMDKYADALIGFDINGDGSVNYSDALAYDAFADSAGSYGDLNVTFAEMQGYEHNGNALLLTASDFAKYDVNSSIKNTASFAENLLISSGMLYVSGGADGLYAYDLSTDTNLSAPDVYASGANILDTALFGNYAVLANGTNGIKIVDTVGSEPDVNLTPQNSITDVVVNTDYSYAYVADALSGIGVLDMSAGTASASLSGTYYNGFYNTYSQSANDIAIDSAMNHLFVITDNYLYTLDVSTDPGAPALLNTAPANTYYPGTMNEMVLSYNDTALYIATNKGIRVMDVYTDTANPAEIEILNGSEEFVSVKVEGNALYALTKRSGTILKYDITDPYSPLLTDTITDIADYADVGDLTSLALFGDYAYAGYSGGFNVVDMANAFNLTYGSYVKTDYRVMDININTGTDSVDYAYTAAYDDVFAIYNMSDPLKPTLASKPPLPSGAGSSFVTKLQMDSSNAFLLADSALYHFDISTAGSESGSTYFDTIYAFDSGIALAGGADLVLDNTTLYTFFSNNVFAFNVSSGIGDIASSAQTNDFDFYDAVMYTENETSKYLLSASNAPGVDVYTEYLSFNDSVSITGGEIYTVGTFGTEMFAGGLTSLKDEIIGVLEISDLSTISYLISANDAIPVSGTPVDITSDANYIYVANGSGVSVVAYDTYNSSGYFEAGFIKTPGDAVSVFVDNTYLYISDSYGGMMIVPIPTRVPPYYRNNSGNIDDPFYNILNGVTGPVN